MIQSGQNLKNSIDRLYDQPLSEKESSEAVRNLTGFFSVLIEINQSLDQKK